MGKMLRKKSLKPGPEQEERLEDRVERLERVVTDLLRRIRKLEADSIPFWGGTCS